MAQTPMQLSEILWDTAKDVATLTLVARDAPPPKTGVLAWYEGPHATVTISVPVKRPAETADTGIALTEGPDGQPVYTRWTWNGTTWVNPVRVNHDGTPWVAG